MKNIDDKILRKVQRKIIEGNLNGDELRNLLGIDVPYVEKEPSLSDYGLKEGDITNLEENDKIFEEKKEKLFNKIVIIFVLVGAFTCGTLFLCNFASIWGKIIGALGGGFWGSIAGGIIGGFIGSIIHGEEPRKDDLRKKIEAYETEKFGFDYWQRRKQQEYWKNLSGHEFENEVAIFFRRQGYSTQVSTPGGDEGIDILLETHSEKIIVQCKAHNKPVGPSVARDLFGTMNHRNINRGIIVSLSGFTSGVYNFVKDKSIELLSLDDIIDNT